MVGVESKSIRITQQPLFGALRITRCHVRQTLERQQSTGEQQTISKWIELVGQFTHPATLVHTDLVDAVPLCPVRTFED